MGIQQSRQLDRNFFAVARRTLDLSGFGYVRRHRDAHAAEQLNPFRNGIDQLNLLIVVFVIKQMQLIKRWSSDLPVRLLIQVAKGHGIGEDLVQLLRHLQTYGFLEFERKQMGHRAVSLDLTGLLMETWL